jgi:ribosomal protein S6
LRTYEVAFIAAPNTAEDDLSKLNYRIGKFDEGVDTFVHLEGSGKEIAEVERRLRVTDFVIRYLTVRTDEALKRAEKLKSKRKVSLAPRSPEDDFDLDLDLEDEELMGEI